RRQPDHRHAEQALRCLWLDHVAAHAYGRRRFSGFGSPRIARSVDRSRLGLQAPRRIAASAHAGGRSTLGRRRAPPPPSLSAYDHAPKPGLEHPLLLLEGQLEIPVGGASHELKAGDCLRYQLFGPSAFATPKKSSARYLIFMV